MGNIRLYKGLRISDYGRLYGAQVRKNTLARTKFVCDFPDVLTSEDVLATDSIASMLPKQDPITIAAPFATALTDKGLRLTSSPSNEQAYLPDAFKLNWVSEPSYMLSFWHTVKSPVSTVQFAPFIGWGATTSDYKWLFGPWGSSSLNTLLIEGAQQNYGDLSDLIDAPQLVTAFVKSTGAGECDVTFYKNGSIHSSQEGVSRRSDPTSAAGDPRIGGMPSLNKSYNGVVHSLQIAEIPDEGIVDEAGWVASEYENYKDKYL